MNNYWDSSSAPTTAGQTPARLPAPAAFPWEYARLVQDLYAGGSAPACIQRPDSDDGDLTDTETFVEVFDKILPGSTSLLTGTIVKIVKCNSLNRWYLDDWTAIRR